MKPVDRIAPPLIGALLLALRLFERTRAVDAAGLPTLRFPILLPALAVAALLFILRARRLGAEGTLAGGFDKRFDFGGQLPVLLSVLGSFLLLAAAALTPVERALPEKLRIPAAAFLALCAAAMLYAVFSLRRGRDFMAVALLAPECYLVVRIVIHYRDNARDPVLQNYYVELLALAALCLALLWLAAFSFQSGSPRGFAAMGQLAVAVTLAALPDFLARDRAMAVAAGGFALIVWAFLIAADFDE